MLAISGQRLRPMKIPQSTILELAKAAATRADGEALVHYANNCLFCLYDATSCADCPSQGRARETAKRYGIIAD
jgi:hypothetical protein